MKTIFTGILGFALIGAIIFGWGRCIYKFVSCDFEPSYKAEIIYGGGIVLGYGAVIGYFDFGK
jgi:hypothetical protein